MRQKEYNEQPPELTREIHVSNLVIRMDAKIKEIIDYAKMYTGQFEPEADEVLKTIIEKLDSI